MEAGLVERYKEIFWPRKDKCDHSDEVLTTEKAVHVADVIGALIVLGVGLGVAGGVLCLELLLNQVTRARKFAAFVWSLGVWGVCGGAKDEPRGLDGPAPSGDKVSPDNMDASPSL